MYESNNINNIGFNSPKSVLGYNNYLNIQNSIQHQETNITQYNTNKMKRVFDNTNEENYPSQSNKRCRKSSDLNDRQTFNCELCTSTFVNSTNLRQHIESFHMKTSMWTCSECKKLFTSKSNLKVHLRVHTRVKPYHCKSCNYSCMHHSSIKEHLAKVHPGVVHSSANPAYAFNSIAVPDPDEFNSANFNREAFIAEAKQANEKLATQINFKYRINSSTNSSNVSSVSPKSIHSSPNLSISHQENSINDYDEHNISELEFNKKDKSSESKETSLNGDLLENSLTSQIKQTQSSTPKSLSFSISSLINENKSHDKQDGINNLNQYVSSLNSSNIWSYSNQVQIFYNYLQQLQQQQQQYQQFNMQNNLAFVPSYFNFKN